MSLPPKPTLLVISQTYPPDPTAVGQYMADAADEMARRGWRVVVYTARRGYTDPAQKYPRRETVDGVEIRRLPLSSFGKGSIAVRLVAQVLFTLQTALGGLFLSRLRSVLVSTSPPMSGAAALWLRFWRRTAATFWVMDLNVDQMIASGMLSTRSPFAWLLRGVYRRTLQAASEIVALDRFMQQRIANSYGVTRPVQVIPPWPHDDLLAPVAHQSNPFRTRHHLEGKFVFMYSGNMGIGHPIGVLLEAARRLEDLPEVVFAFIGGGVRRREVETAIRERNPRNLLLLPYQPYDQLRFSLSAADVHLVTMDDTGVGCFHPCKAYGAMAVARPVLFAGPDPSHMTDLLLRYRMGWRIAADDPTAAAAMMRQIATMDRDELLAMGRGARQAVAEDLSKSRLCNRFCDILAGIEPQPHSVAVGPLTSTAAVDQARQGTNSKRPFEKRPMERRDQAMQLLRECVEEYAEQTGGSYDLENDTPLIGPDSPVDSLGLVMIITAFEARLNETYNAELVLASEKAMSLSRSPFRTLGTLADYAVELLDEAGVKA